MKKSVLIFALLGILLISRGVNVGSGDTIICGYVEEAWFSYPCMGPWPMDTCDGYRVFLWDPPEAYKGHYMILVNPVWSEKCDDACGGCDVYIVDCEDAFYISSCAECSESEDPCEGMFCGEECFGCDLWMTECVDGKCVKDYIIERDSKRCGCGDPCEGKDCPPECYGCDYWATECEDGECVKDYIIERDSKRCGCGEDPCEDVVCDPKCDGCDYWATECEDGECVKDYIIEKDSKRCGCGEKDEDDQEVDVWDTIIIEVLERTTHKLKKAFEISAALLLQIVIQVPTPSYESPQVNVFLDTGPSKAVYVGDTVTYTIVAHTGVLTDSYLIIELQRREGSQWKTLGKKVMVKSMEANKKYETAYQVKFKESGYYKVFATLDEKGWGGSESGFQYTTVEEREEDEGENGEECLGTSLLMAIFITAAPMIYRKRN